MKKITPISTFSAVAFAAALILSLSTPPAGAEQCVAGVQALNGWAGAISGNANQWPANARKAGFQVDHTPEAGAVIVYPPTYGRGINATYGHVAVIVDAGTDKQGMITIKDSNGVCKGNRKQCKVRQPIWNKVWVIHPPKK